MRPNKCTGMIPTVRSVTRASSDPVARLKVARSMSQNTGTAPQCSTIAAVATQVKAGTITSSPGFNGRAFNATCKAPSPRSLPPRGQPRNISRRPPRGARTPFPAPAHHSPAPCARPRGPLLRATRARSELANSQNRLPSPRRISGAAASHGRACSFCPTPRESPRRSPPRSRRRGFGSRCSRC